MVNMPMPLLTGAGKGKEGKGMGWEGIKGFIPLKEVQRERTGGAIRMGGKRRDGPAAGAILLQSLKGG